MTNLRWTRAWTRAQPTVCDSCSFLTTLSLSYAQKSCQIHHQPGTNLPSVEHGIPFRAHNVATNTFAAMDVSPSAHAAPQIQHNAFILHHADVEIQNRGNPRYHLLEMSMRALLTHHCKLPPSILPLLSLPTGKLNHLPTQLPHF